MHIERHTLPVLALAVFIVALWVNALTYSTGTLAIVTPASGLGERSSLFPVAPSVQAAAVVNVTDAQLKAYWHFNDKEGSSLLSDGSLKGHSGVIHGNPTRVEGREGTALLFDGVDDYVVVKDSTDLDLTTAFTLSAWVRPTENHVGRILSKNGFDEDARDGYVLSVNGEALEYSVQNRASVSSSKIALEPNKWAHVVVTYGSSVFPTTRLFVNGERVFSSSTHTPIKNGVELLIGRGNDGNYFKGAIDEIRIHKKAFLDSEIQKMYEAYDGIPFPPEPEEMTEEESEDTAGEPNPLAALLVRITEAFALVEKLQADIATLQGN